MRKTINALQIRSIAEGRLDIALETKPTSPPIAQRPRHVHNITDRFSMSNTYLIDDGRLIVVDPGSLLNVNLTLDYLRHFLHRSPSDIDLIVLTHLHPDHTSGVTALRQVCPAPVTASIIAQQLLQLWRGENLEVDERKAAQLKMLLGQATGRRSLPGTIHQLDLFNPAYARHVQMVDIWLDDVVGLPNHPGWRVIASPGYSPESLCLYNPFSYELLCGDTIVTVEGGSILARGGSNRSLLEETLNTLRELTVYYLYPGHGRPILARQALASAHIE